MSRHPLLKYYTMLDHQQSRMCTCMLDKYFSNISYVRSSNECLIRWASVFFS